jgi:alanyl-tRNA synthetase
MNNVTEKLYYTHLGLRKCNAKIVGIEGDALLCDRTIFFPEGGGQVGDIGSMNGWKVIDTQKRGGRAMVTKDLPIVNVETEILHRLAPGGGGQFAVGESVELTVDPVHRRKCQEHHSAVHVVMGAIWDAFGRDSFVTQGCRISPEGARLDLFTSQRFAGELLERMEARANEWIGTNAVVEMLPVEGIPEMFIWNCPLNQSLRQPCGGTHVTRLGQIGTLRIKRNNKGKSLERLYITCSGEE